MPIWLRLTHLFGLQRELKDSDHIILASIGPILRADAAELVEAPMPAQFVRLLSRLEQRERNIRSGRKAWLHPPRRLPAPTNDNRLSPDLPATGTV